MSREANHDKSNYNATGNDMSPIISMIRCPHCDHLVPETNMESHEARTCEARKLAGAGGVVVDTNSQPSSSSSSSREENSWETLLSSYPESGSDEDEVVAPRVSNRRRRVRRNRAAIPENNNVIDLMDIDNSEEDTQRGLEDEEDQWTCSRCTLINPSTANVCEACMGLNPNQRHLVQTSFLDNNTSNMSSALSGGAIVGSLLGAAASYANGRSVTSGAFQGAMHGAIGAAFLDELLAENSNRTSRGFLRSNRDSNNNQQPRRRTGFFLRRSAPATAPSTSTTTSTRNRSDVDQGDPFDPFSSMLLQSILVSHHPALQSNGSNNSSNNIDTMTYEQLLHLFGDGSDNLGASRTQISALPETVITKDTQLPEALQQCAICLSDFEVGDKRKVLPCLHGFHPKCVTKWLRKNGACPMCKFRINDS